MARRNRNRNTAAAATPKSNFTAPAPGLEDVHFTHRNSKAAAVFGVVRKKFALPIGSKDKGYIGYK